MARKAKGEGGELLTLSEVGERTGISMPSLLRYKKEHQGRIPAVGKGRTQRYPAEALEVFEAIKRENLSKRGRPKAAGGGGEGRAGRTAGGAGKTASGGGRRGGRRAAAAGGGGDAGGGQAGGELLTLTEVAEQAGISYPTARNYAEQHGDRIPSVGEGRKRRYRPEAVAVFQEIRAASRPGRKPAGGAVRAEEGRRSGARADGGAPARAARGSSDGVGSPELVRRVEELAKRQERLGRELAALQESLLRPVEATLRQ